MTAVLPPRPPDSSAAPAVAASWRDQRPRVLIALGGAVAMVVAIAIAGVVVAGPAGVTELGDRNLSPSWNHPFGTDRYGRDVFLRSLVGLRMSLTVGLVAALISGAAALVFALIAAVGGPIAEAVVNWLVDLFLALPHLVLLILIAFALGGGTQAVIIAVGVTHWPRLTRVLLAVVRQEAGSEYVAISRALGRSRSHIARRHLAPGLIPQLSVGVILMFPHAIMHEAALSFLGLGMDPGEPAIGVMLAESMRYLSAGHWWLAVLPGLALLILVKLVDTIGDGSRRLIDPRSHHL